MSALTDLQTNLSNSFSALSSREKKMLIFAGLAVLVFVMFMVLFSSAKTANDIRSRTMKKIQNLEEVQELASGYGDAKAKQSQLEAQLQASNVRLISFLEEKAQKAKLELPSINPKADLPLENSKIVESSVELTLTDVKLNRLLDFVSSVEAGPGIVKVKYMRLEPRLPQESITAFLTISTYKLKN
jgi:general secretion pathway protein M